MAGIWFTLGMGCFAGGLLISGGILAWQALQWLQFGFWPDIPVSYAFDYFQIRYPVVAWVGVQKMGMQTRLTPFAFAAASFGAE
jgi:hypothetical protein